MRNQSRFVRLALLACLASLCAAGCASNAAPTPGQKLLERRTQRRLASIDWTLTTALEREARRPEQLGQTLAVAERKLLLDAQHTDRDLRWAADRIGFEFDRWEDRQAEYQRRIGRLLWGKPETIEQTAITLFW